MNTVLTYIPGTGILLNDKTLNWGVDRTTVRGLLNSEYREENNIIDLGEYSDDKKEEKIIQRRDLYQNFGGGEGYFFLNYDTNDKLLELEVQQGMEIVIGKVKIDFSMKFDDVVALLNGISSINYETSEGERFFNDLKLSIASEQAMGSGGHNLAYFYCAKDTTHLLE